MVDTRLGLNTDTETDGQQVQDSMEVIYGRI